MTTTSESAPSGASSEASAGAAAVAGEDEPGSEPAGGPSEPPEPESTPPPTPTGPVEVAVRPGVTVDAAWISARLAAAVGLLGTAPARVSVVVTDDAGMTDLHRRHRRTPEATDVLAFPASDPGDPLEADVAVNADEARRQATPRGHAVERELLLYALHGVLHCVGYDDHSPEDATAMHGEEDRILRAIGVGSTFAPDEDAP